MASEFSKLTIKDKNLELDIESDPNLTQISPETFKTITQSKDKDTFIMFYSEPHPKIFAEWQKLGQEFSDNPNLVIAIYDRATFWMPGMKS